jgi:hypothetical protein
LIDEHGEALLSDMLHYYRVDLRELFSREAPLSPRWVLSLILNLPSTGAFWASRSGGKQFRGWDVDRYALVSLVDAVRVNNYILTMVNRDPKKSKPKPPEPFPTPYTENKTAAAAKHKPGSFAAIAASMLAAQKRKRELLNGA